jgi:hypothetical protein
LDLIESAFGGIGELDANSRVKTRYVLTLRRRALLLHGALEVCKGLLLQNRPPLNGQHLGPNLRCPIGQIAV